MSVAGTILVIALLIALLALRHLWRGEPVRYLVAGGLVVVLLVLAAIAGMYADTLLTLPLGEMPQ